METQKEIFKIDSWAEMSPSLVLEGDIPRLIDEWQEVPQLWDAVRYKVDQTGQKGQFILTGSATPNHKGILHSGSRTHCKTQNASNVPI